MRLAVAAGLLACLVTDAAACTTPPQAIAGSFVTDKQPGVGVSAAWFAEATTIYDHGILGDAVEAATLSVNSNLAGPTGCDALSIAAGEGHVFEDTAPRIFDLDGDGRKEVIVVRTSLTQGAQLAIYGLRDGDLTILSTTPYIGQTHRWLAPIGAGDIDGDGRIEVAYIDRPHLAKVMRVWRFDGVALTEGYRIEGLTNHRIGDRTISGGFRTCDGVTEAVTASADWSRIIATRIEEGRALVRDLGPTSGTAAFATAMNCKQ